MNTAANYPVLEPRRTVSVSTNPDRATTPPAATGVDRCRCLSSLMLHADQRHKSETGTPAETSCFNDFTEGFG